MVLPPAVDLPLGNPICKACRPLGSSLAYTAAEKDGHGEPWKLCFVDVVENYLQLLVPMVA